MGAFEAKANKNPKNVKDVFSMDWQNSYQAKPCHLHYSHNIQRQKRKIFFRECIKCSKYSTSSPPNCVRKI